MKNLIFISLFLCLLSCSNDPVTGDEIQSEELLTEKIEMLSFKDWDAFYEQYNEISKMDQSDLVIWAQSAGHSSLLETYQGLNNDEAVGEFWINSQDDIDALTNGLRAILNDNMKFQVGEKTILYSDKTFYELSDSDSKLDLTSKSNLPGLKKIGSVEMETVQFSDSETSRTFMYSAALAGSYQKEFKRDRYLPCGGTTYQGTVCCRQKHVFELRTRRFSVGYPNVLTELYLDVKMEWLKENRGWKPAGEDRRITVNISGTAENTARKPEFQQISVNKSLYCVNYNQQMLLATAQYAENIENGAWFVTASGNIYQRINGDTTASEWGAYVVW